METVYWRPGRDTDQVYITLWARMRLQWCLGWKMTVVDLQLRTSIDSFCHCVSLHVSLFLLVYRVCIARCIAHPLWEVFVCASSFCVVLCCACQPDLYIYKVMAHIVVFWWWLFLMRTQVVCWMICICCLGPPSKRSWEYLWEGILTSLSETYGWELYTS